jgi:hypothetical protein
MPAYDVSGPLADHVLELYRRAAFLEVFAVLLAEYPDPEGILTPDSLKGFYYAARDLNALARAVNNRVYAEI